MRAWACLCHTLRPGGMQRLRNQSLTVNNNGGRANSPQP